MTRPQNRAEARAWLEAPGLHLPESAIVEILGFLQEAWDLGALWMVDNGYGDDDLDLLSTFENPFHYTNDPNFDL